MVKSVWVTILLNNDWNYEQPPLNCFKKIHLYTFRFNKVWNKRCLRAIPPISSHLFAKQRSWMAITTIWPGKFMIPEHFDFIHLSLQPSIHCSSKFPGWNLLAQFHKPLWAMQDHFQWSTCEQGYKFLCKSQIQTRQHFTRDKGLENQTWDIYKTEQYTIVFGSLVIGSYLSGWPVIGLLHNLFERSIHIVSFLVVEIFFSRVPILRKVKLILLWRV